MGNKIMSIKINKVALFSGVFIFVFFLFSGLSHASVLSKPPNNLGLIGYWSFDEGSGSLATDFSGNGNAGTLTAMEEGDWVDGKIGGGLVFDGGGSNEYVTTGDIGVTGSDNITVSVWYKHTSGSNQTSMAIGADTVATGDQWRHVVGADTVTVSVTGGNRVWTATNNNDGNWHHFAVVRTGTDTDDLVGYFDGQPAGVDSTSSITISLDGGLTEIGRYDGNVGDGYFDGSLDEVRVYNRQLSAAEVLALYQRQGRVRVNTSQIGVLDDNLVGFWNFDGPYTSSTVEDVSSNNNNGTLVGTVSKVSGKIGQGLHFKAVVGAYVNIGTSTDLDITENLSLSFWLKPDANFTPVVLHRGDVSGAKEDVWWHVIARVNDGTNGLEFRFGNGTTGYFIRSNHPVPINEWTHVIVARDSTTAYIYINGILSKSEAHGIDMSSPSLSRNTYFGLRRDNQTSYGGILDEVRIYDKTLNQAEVIALYKSGISKVNTSQSSSLASGLIGMWDFNGPNLVAATSVDVSSNSNDGTLVSSPDKFRGKLGQALKFNGSSSYVSLPINNSFNFDQAFTISAWAMQTGSGTNARQAFFSNWVYDQNNESNGVYLSWQTDVDSINEFGYSVGPGDSFIITTPVKPQNEWHHFVGTYDPTLGSQNAKFYVDGVSVGTADYTSTYTVNRATYVGALSPGDNPSSVERFFNGAVDEVRVYDRALSASEVLQLYNMNK